LALTRLTTEEGHAMKMLKVPGVSLVVMVIGSAFLVTNVSGCKKTAPVVISGVVTNAADGKPLAGVRVNASPVAHFEGEDGGTTDAEGKFSFTCHFQWGSQTKWSLELGKDRFETETVDLSFIQPKDETQYAAVVVQMKAKR
jgi:hypothetical protein